MHHLAEFVTHHWLLVFITLIVFVLLVREEAFSKGGFGANLTPHMVTQKINRENALVVDIRSDEAFRLGHIVGSLSMPADRLDKKMKKLNAHKHRPLILVCEHGIQASKRVKPLKEAGFQVFTLSGGVAAWKRAKLPVTSK